MHQEAILEINDLALSFPVYRGQVKALNHVSLSVEAGEIVGIVGESGSGKSVTAMLVMRLLNERSYRVEQGHVHFQQQDLLGASERELRKIRGREIAMIFQEPMNALNPTKTVGKQLMEVLRLHQPFSRHAAHQRVIELLTEMQIPDPQQVFNRYPFELSGGMRQRVLIAMAFSCNPKLIIADEPTTALDVTVQRQILNLLKMKAKERGTAVLFITHDMAVISQLCDKVYVMYAGSVVESGETEVLLHESAHPYTRGLLACAPELVAPQSDIETIAGTVPDLTQLPDGCAFRERCSKASAQCRRRPPLQVIDENAQHDTMCWHPLTTEEA
ncbi:ABC transporter ATP-binding protein [Celerinatantimonas sp. YJH-8]|uniref:ABC transporter ATP-binding protein n=1 Tax=Celerinatantimonas sp. YJH-8 TaxID=3228714 RepID=UPI0038C4832C